MLIDAITQEHITVLNLFAPTNIASNIAIKT